MLWKRSLSFGLLGIMLVVQAHAALPHQHVEAGGSCGVVCHDHEADLDGGWLHALLHGVHDVLHQHAASMDCEEASELLRPEADEGALDVLHGVSVGRICREVEGVRKPSIRWFQVPAGRSGFERSHPHRGPPSKE